MASKVVTKVSICELSKVARARWKAGHVETRRLPDRPRTPIRQECAKTFGQPRQVKHVFDLQMHAYLQRGIRWRNLASLIKSLAHLS